MFVVPCGLRLSLHFQPGNLFAAVDNPQLAAVAHCGPIVNPKPKRRKQEKYEPANRIDVVQQFAVKNSITKSHQRHRKNANLHGRKWVEYRNSSKNWQLVQKLFCGPPATITITITYAVDEERRVGKPGKWEGKAECRRQSVTCERDENATIQFWPTSACQ